MTPDQMTELAARLLEHAAQYRDDMPSDLEGWAADLSAAADLIDSMAQRVPVAWADPLDIGEDQVAFYGASHRWHVGHDGTRYSMPLYSAPAAQRVPLPGNEIVTMYAECPRSDAEMIEFARAIEQAHGIVDRQEDAA